MKRVLLDPGHGGADPGAISSNGYVFEKNIALAVCKRAQEIFNERYPQVDCSLTRSADVFLSLSKRAQISTDLKADAFVSVHCNSASSTRAHGYECFTTRGNTNSDRLATCLMDSYAKMFPNRKARKDESDGDPDKERDFVVIGNQNTRPAALFELEFIHTLDGANFLNSKVNQAAMASALVEGIADFLGVGEIDDGGDFTPDDEKKPRGKDLLEGVYFELDKLAKLLEQ